MEPGCCAPVEPVIQPDEAPVQETVRTAPESGRILLFKTPTCPNCKAAMALLDRAGIGYEALDANQEKEMVERFGVKQAPTLVLVQDTEYQKYRGVSEIKGWLMHHSA